MYMSLLTQSTVDWTLTQTSESIRQRRREKVERRRLEAELAEMREDLIAAKSALSDLNLVAWREFTNSRHKGAGIIRDVKKRSNPELCTQVSGVYILTLYRDVV